MAASEKQTRSFRVEAVEVAMQGRLLLLPDPMLVAILVMLVPPWTDAKRLAANKCMNKITETHTAFIGHVAATKSLSRCFVLTAQIPASIPSWCFGVVICADFNEDMLQQLGGMCHSVSSFYLDRYPQITNVGLSHLLARCSSLTNVVLDSSPHVTDAVFGLLASSAGLKLLCLSGCHGLRGATASKTNLSMSCRNIVNLDLSYTEITATALSVLGTQFLTTLCLIKSNLTDASLRSIVDKSPNLTSLWISGCAITNAGVDAIAAGCHAIRSLALDECNISDTALHSISKGCPAITDLDLSKCPEITDAGLVALAAGCESIRVMHLSGCKKINNGDTLGTAPLSELLELSTLNLDGCELGKNFIGLCGLWSACPNITTLSLGSGGVTSISDAQLDLVAIHLRHLTELDLSCNSKITDQVLKSLGHWCTTLTTLDISHCKEIGDEGMAYLAGCTAVNTGCTALTILDISHCKKIGDKGVAYLAACSRLNTLNINHCTQIKTTGLSAMATGCLGIAFIGITGCTRLIALCSPEGRMPVLPAIRFVCR